MLRAALVALAAAFVVAASPALAVNTHGRFVATTALVNANYETDGVANAACVAEYGTNYRVADWNDVVAFFSTSSEASVKEFYVNLGILPYFSWGWNEFPYLVSFNGAERYFGRRHYYVTRHDHNIVPGYEIHETINARELNLGSWWVTARALCFRD